MSKPVKFVQIKCQTLGMCSKTIVPGWNCLEVLYRAFRIGPGTIFAFFD